MRQAQCKAKCFATGKLQMTRIGEMLMFLNVSIVWH